MFDFPWLVKVFVMLRFMTLCMEKKYFEVDDYGMMKKFLADKMMMFDLLNLCFCIEKFEKIHIIFRCFVLTQLIAMTRKK